MRALCLPFFFTLDDFADARFAGRKYIANLRSIIPLPDATRQPLHEFPSGTSVMALYPETTSFYKAFIQSGPERQEKEREKGKVRTLSPVGGTFLLT